MKKVINGIVCDTEIAKKVAVKSYKNLESPGDWWEQTLYKTAGGHYFLCYTAGKDSAPYRWSPYYKKYGYAIHLLQDKGLKDWKWRLD